MIKDKIYKGYRICIALLLLYAIIAKDYFCLALSAWFMVDCHFGEIKRRKNETHNIIPTCIGGDPLNTEITFWGGKPTNNIKSEVIHTDN